ncbi:MAG: J domain-containing protein [Bdellovibrionales bacterium]|nr:J domain-containing protein [Bdellovibrionales bacterium]
MCYMRISNVPFGKRFILALALLCGQSIAWAEAISVYGTSFDAQNFAEVDGSYVRLKIDGGDRLLPKAAYKEILALDVLRHDRQEFSSLQLIDFAQSALRESPNFELIGVAFARAFTKSRTPLDLYEQVQVLIQKHAKKEEIEKSLVRELPSTSPVFARIVISLGGEQEGWLKQNVAAKLYEAKHALIEEVQRLGTKRIGEGLLSLDPSISQLLDHIYGSQDPELKNARSLFARFDIAAEKIDERKFSEAYSLLEPFASGAHGESFARATVLFLHKKVQKVIESESKLDAIHTLALISFRYRTPETHELVLQAIKAYPVNLEPMWSYARTDTFLLALAKKDPQIFDAYLEYLEKVIAYFVPLTDQGEALRHAVRKLSDLRPDPNAHNDNLRMDITIDLFRQGRREESLQMLASLKGELGIANKLRLFFEGVYIRLSLLALIVFSPILLWLLIKIFVRSYSKPKHQFARLKKEAAKSQESTVSPRFIRREGLDPRIVEYLELLKSLELEDKATEREIKRAYRNKMKTLHPDLRQTTTDMTKDFVKLKAVYERILALREELGL